MEFLCPAIFVILVIAGIAAAIQGANKLEAAKKAYQKSLSRLRHDPNNAVLRKNALGLGRVYSNLTRNKKGVSLFDEVALKNDIDAACAGAVIMAQSGQHMAAHSVQERLASLDELRQSGMITDSEYIERRKRILDSI
jgi:hypothetical protein